MIFITAVHLEYSGSTHRHIASVRWKEPTRGETGEVSREVMVDFINAKKGDVKVTDGRNTVDVGVWEGKWLRTYADRTWTDNLLALPRF